jgi:hypothetical protein
MPARWPEIVIVFKQLAPFTPDAFFIHPNQRCGVLQKQRVFTTRNEFMAYRAGSRARV